MSGPRTAAAVVLMLHLLAAVRAIASSEQQQRCDDDADVNFELLTGYAASTAAKHAMRQQLALFTLPQCIDACKTDDQCAVVTYETGACVSYAAVQHKNADAGTLCFSLSRRARPFGRTPTETYRREHFAIDGYR